MKVWIAMNDCGYIVGVFDTEAQARAARLEAELRGVECVFVQSATINDSRYSVTE